MVPVIPAEIRRRALAAIRTKLPAVLLVMLFASLPSLVFSLAMSLSADSLVKAYLMYQNANLTYDVLRRIALAAAQNMGQPFDRAGSIAPPQKQGQYH